MQDKTKPSLGNERRFVLEVCDGNAYFILNAYTIRTTPSLLLKPVCCFVLKRMV